MTRLRMTDFWTFKPKEVMQDKRSLFECTDATSPTGSSLFVKVAATHSGVVNQNHRFYRPDRMQDAAHQWIPVEGKGYAKPVLVEHNKKGDVLGRVHTARYIDESYKWTEDFPTIKDSIFYKSADKKIDLFKSVDWIIDNLMGLPDYSGLGFIELGLNVTNPDAIAKVLRDEYLTVSVGFQTDSAICNVCYTDWAKDDKCEHRPGTKDSETGRTAFLICGDFIYEELSFVNFPADPFAGKVSKDTLKDSLNRKFFMGLSHDKQQAFVTAAGMSMSDAILDYDVRLVEGNVATIYDLTVQDNQTSFEAEIKDSALTSERSVELKKVLQDWKPETETDKTKKRSLVSTLNAKIRKNNWTDTSSTSEEENEIQAAISNTTKDTCEIDWTKEQLSTEEAEYFSDEEGLYAEMLVEMDAALQAGELTDGLIKDAKLSSEARKNLGSSTFCGPNRSFPVPDCAHVTAARRLIGRAKVGDATKSKILACVSRKSSSLGCSVSTKDNSSQVTEKTDTIKEEQDSMIQKFVDEANMGNSAADVLGHYDGLARNYKGADDDLRSRMRHLHYRVGEHWDSTSALEWAKAHVKAHAKDEVLVSTKDWEENQAAVTKLSDEIEVANDSVIAAKNTSSELLKSIKKSLATQIVIYKSLTGHSDFKDLDLAKINAKIEELSKRHVTSLRDAVADIMSELKWIDSTEAQPTTKVKEHSQSVDDSAQVEQSVAALETAVVPTEVETEASKLKKLEVADAAIRDRLVSMTPRERNIYLADLAYNNAKPANASN